MQSLIDVKLGFFRTLAAGSTSCGRADNATADSVSIKVCF